MQNQKITNLHKESQRFSLKLETLDTFSHFGRDHCQLKILQRSYEVHISQYQSKYFIKTKIIFFFFKIYKKNKFFKKSTTKSQPKFRFKHPGEINN